MDLNKYCRVLTIAGSDSGGGAGIQADIKTISAHGCYATSVITAVTAQNTTGVKEIHPIPANIVRSQLQAVLEDIGADAIKIGMLCNKEIVNVVADELERYKIKNVVLDPILLSTSGHHLLEESAIELLKNRLFPLSTLITPNLPEVEVLMPHPFVDVAEVSNFFYQKYKTSVYLKGGHMEGSMCVDYVFEKGSKKPIIISSPKVKTKNLHGTGCTLSSALACGFAKGKEFQNVCKDAHDYVFEALKAGMNYELGTGNGPLKLFYDNWT